MGGVFGLTGLYTGGVLGVAGLYVGGVHNMAWFYSIWMVYPGWLG